jgi:hypothetical protein
LFPKGVSTLLGGLLAVWATAWGASKHSLPGSSAQDVWRAGETQVVEGDEHVYVYGSLFLHPGKPDNTEFFLTPSRRMHTIPLIALNIYHDIDTYIQSEFLDFTLWGMLGNYFNKNIEAIEFENEILRIFRQLEDLNKKYQSLVAQSHNSKKEDLITLSNSQFFKQQEHIDTNGDYKDSNGQKDIKRLLQEYTAKITFHIRKAEDPEKKSFESAPSMSAQSSMALSAEPRNENEHKVFFRLINLLRYLLTHKLEAAIYLSVVVFVVTSVKMVVRGLKQ